MKTTSRSVRVICGLVGCILILSLLLIIQREGPIGVDNNIIDSATTRRSAPRTVQGPPGPIKTTPFTPPSRSKKDVTLDKRLFAYAAEQREVIRLASELFGQNVPWELLESPWDAERIKPLLAELQEQMSRLRQLENAFMGASDTILQRHYANGNWSAWRSDGPTVTLPNPANPASPIVRGESPWDGRRRDEAMLEAGGVDAEGKPEIRVVRLLPEDDADYAAIVLDRNMKRDEVRREAERLIIAYSKQRPK